MSFYSDKEAVFILVELCKQRGIEHVIVSPGSRNAPIALSFASQDNFRMHVIVDERSAAFYALGIAIHTEKPVVIICTSGSAILNYTPAVAEAYYQQVPLVVISADRPEEWIDQNDGQTIRQRNVLDEFTTKSVHIPQAVLTEDDRWFTARLINEALNCSVYPKKGPIHINIPFREPLYGKMQEGQFKSPKHIGNLEPLKDLSFDNWEKLEEEFVQFKKVLVIAGCMMPNTQLNNCLNEFASFSQVSVFTETTSNLVGKELNPSIDNLLFSFSGEEEENSLAPDLLLTLGGQVVSKKIKAFLRKHRVKSHWHIHPQDLHMDTYQSLTYNVTVPPEVFFSKAKHWKKRIDSDYKSLWKERDSLSEQKHNAFLAQAPYSDLKVFEQIINLLPEHAVLHLGNSTPVRYLQLFTLNRGVTCFANRGTSGIDGTVSTAVGAAISTPTKSHYLITGDLAFFYDSNGLWVEQLPANLGIIVINNSGGGIFRIIEGPEDSNATKRFLETRHNLNAAGIASTFGANYTSCKQADELEQKLLDFFNDTAFRILEIFTPAEENDKVLKAYIEFLRV